MTKQRILFSYAFHFDVWAVVLLATFMFPYAIWSFTHGDNDMLDIVSNTPGADKVALLCQTLMLTLLICFRRADAPKHMRSWANTGLWTTAVLYLACWVFYFVGYPFPGITLAMAIFPCLTFVFFCLGRRAWLAMVFCVSFLVLHVSSAIINYPLG